jgi:xanthine dehydrogenase accessory factor
MAMTYIYHDSKDYYQALVVAGCGADDCYEMTALNGGISGLKACFFGNDLYVLSEGLTDEDSLIRYLEAIPDENADIFREPLPAIRSCSGWDFFVEKLGGRQHMVICGAGHVSVALIKIARMTGFQVTVIDDRPAFCNQARMAGADEVLCEPFGQTIHAMNDNDSPYFVVVTRGHQYDVDCLHEILHMRHSYIGMMGSRVRVKNIKAGLLEEGFDPDLIESLHMPIGLPIGAQSPEEIAVSIMAEIIACRHKEKENYHYSGEMLKTLCGRDNEGLKKALAVIVVKKGCGPREAGTKMIVLEDGRIIGTIGGGCAEAAVIQKARYCMQQSVCSREHVDMTGREAAENGLVCGGIMDVFIQPF